MKIVKEHFNSISEMMDILDKRPNNKIMQHEHSSSTEGDRRWYGTNTYEEASQLMRTGYTEIIPEIKQGLSKSAKIMSKSFSSINIRKQRNLPIGFVPNVPNAILNLPNSMIDISITPQKRKTLSIIYMMAGNCRCEAKMWIKAGISLLTAIKIIEKMGISVSIDASFYCGSEQDEIAVGSVCVKHFGQPLDIQKLCFPLAHPSMFRRIGFKFLETTPVITKESFAYGYGAGFECCEKEYKKLTETDKVYVLSGQWIRDHDYKVEEILNYLNFSKNANKDFKRQDGGEQKREVD